jgi:NAD(P)-dependent dehydrogenase (short-subunit alcohol dehydrogenase family)
MDRHQRERTVYPAAIVTGSDSGIGQETAVLLAERGFDVGVTWHSDEDGAQETATRVEAAGRTAHLAQIDLTNLPEAASAVDDLAERLGGLGVMVNNAGGGTGGPAIDLSWEEWRSILSLNLDGAFLCAQHAARIMVAQGTGGRIVNVTSVHEHVPLRGAAAYTAAKGGLGNVTKVLALELAGHGILVNSVAPGEIATPLTGDEDESPETLPRPNIPLGRPGHAREIAAMIGFLASEEASYTTGASFVVDGGLTLMAAIANQEDNEIIGRVGG